MRKIAVKYTGSCSKCGADLPVGGQAMYEKTTGIFCLGCEPKDSEETRMFRQQKADRKADRLDDWASKRVQTANQQLNSHPEIRHDWAFITQPGHIPFRARMFKADDRAFESLAKANSMRARANSLRNVRVKGDADKRRDARRESVRSWLQVGMTVNTAHFGTGKVLKINKNTAKIGETGQSRAYTVNVELSFITKVE